MRVAVSILAMSMLVAACSKSNPDALPKASLTSAALAKTAAPPKAVDEEPPEHVLRELMFRHYAEIERRGGVPMTVTATGYSGIVHAKLYEVRKENCQQLPVDPPGRYECGVDLMATLWWEGRPEPRKPLPDSKRISVIRDGNGVWLDCTYNSDRTSICHTGRKK